MPIAFDAASSGFVTNADTLSYNHTFAGTNLIAWVEALILHSSAQTIVSMTVSGFVATKVAEVTFQKPDTNYIYQSLWYLVAPATGVQAITVLASTSVSAISVHSTSYTGARQTSVPDAFDTDTATGSTTFSEDITPVATGCWAVAAIANADVEQTATAGCVFRSGVGGGDGIFDSNGIVAGLTTFGIGTSPPTSVNWGGVIATFAPAAGKFILIPGR